MFIVTNRDVPEHDKHEVVKGGVDLFGEKPNREGPNELRTAEAERKGGKWVVRLFPDHLPASMMEEVGLKGDPNPTGGKYIARRILGQVNPAAARAVGVKTRASKGRNFLLFVHGYNNDVEDVLQRARRLESLYGVEVLIFTWPANGGGLISGTASYKSDKRDAKASIGALDRVLEFSGKMLQQFTSAGFAGGAAAASALEELRRERQGQETAPDVLTRCPFTVNAVFHSMGNYLYKHMLLSGSSQGTGLLFDNVVLAAADTNNEDHARWVDRIRCRRRVYVTINEDDKALRVSRAKMGDEQKARLGHWPHGLDSTQGIYVQFTNLREVDSSHAYFVDEAVSGSSATSRRLRKFFREAFNGERAEEGLWYDAATNMHMFRKPRS